MRAVPFHHTPFATGPQGQCMLEFQLLIWVVSATKQTVIGRETKKKIRTKKKFEKRIPKHNKTINKTAKFCSRKYCHNFSDENLIPTRTFLTLE